MGIIIIDPKSPATSKTVWFNLFVIAIGTVVETLLANEAWVRAAFGEYGGWIMGALGLIGLGLRKLTTRPIGKRKLPK